MLLLWNLSRIRISPCLRNWQGNAVVITVEVQARLEDSKHVEDASKVNRPLIKSFTFPRSVYSSATASSSTRVEPRLLSRSDPA